MIGKGAQIAESDILRRGRLIGDEILEHATDLRPQLGRIVIPDVDLIDQDATRDGIVEAADQFEEGGLAGTVAADDGDRLAG